jgi:hypothetical protein
LGTVEQGGGRGGGGHPPRDLGKKIGQNFTLYLSFKLPHYSLHFSFIDVSDSYFVLTVG